MASIRGLKGFNRSSVSTSNVLLAAYNSDIINVVTGLGYGLNLNTSNDVEFEVFLDNVFMQNNSDIPLTFNGTVWSRNFVGKTPIAKYLKRFKSKMYLGNCAFVTPQAPLDSSSNAIVFPSRVFYSDFYLGNTLTWGIEWGRNGATTSGEPIFFVTTTGGTLQQDFKAANIKVGDPLFITNGNNQLTQDKPYLVVSVDSAYKLIMDRPFPVTTTGQHFWVGSNWFDVEPDDSDQITGFGENSSRLMIFKLLSFHLYKDLQILKGKGRGTSYVRSVLNDDIGNTYFFHGSDIKLSGIYKFNGAVAIKVSRAIDPYIEGMSSGNFVNVVAWREGNELRWFLGNLSNSNYNISMSNAVATFNLDTGAWDVASITDILTATTTWMVGREQINFCGTSLDKVLQMNNGNAFITTPIAFGVESKVIYPAGSETICEFDYIQVIATNANGVRLRYKLWNNPKNVDANWTALGNLEYDKTEFRIPLNHNTGSGIQFKFEEMSSNENDIFIEKVSIFYKAIRSRLL